MKNTFKFYIVVWAILIAAFNIICFIIPNEIAGMTKTDSTFWTAYIFITAAFIVQLICGYFAFKASNLKKLFYNLSLIKISYTGLVLMLIFGVILMLIPNMPYQIAIIICMLIIVFNIITIIKAKAAVDIVEHIDEKLVAKTALIKELTAKTQNLISNAKNPETTAACKKVFDVVRYSDPMSSSALFETEKQIKDKVTEFSIMLENNDTENITDMADEIVLLVKERNSKCKLLK